MRPMALLIALLLLLTGCGGSHPVPEPVPASHPGPADAPPATDTGDGSGAAGVPYGPEAVARAAVMFGSCVADDQPRTTATMIYTQHDYEPGWLSDLQASVGCLASAGDGCAAVERCLHMSARHVAGCQPGCDGTVATGCDDSLEYRMDCARWGQVCDPERGRCRRASSAPECDEESMMGRCEDGRPVYCSSGYADGMHVYRGPRCEDLGMRCQDDLGTGELAVCQGSGGECETEHWGGLSYDVERGSCRDDVTLDACVNGGVHTVTCESLAQGFRCVRRQGDVPGDMCGLGDECDPFDYQQQARCEGTAVVFCNAGRLEHVDCRTLGFSGCDARMNRCSPGLWSGLAP